MPEHARAVSSNRFCRVLSLFPGLLLLLATAPSGKAAVQPEGCFLHYDFEELKQGQYADASGQGNTATATDVEVTSGVDGHAFAVTRPGAGLAVPVPAPLSQPLAAFSFELWFGLDQVSHVCGLLSSGPDGDQPFFLGMNFGRLDINFKRNDGKAAGGRTPGTVIRLVTRPQRTYYHVVGTYDGRQGRLYVDGKEVLATKELEPASLMPETKPMLIGKKYGTEQFNGAIDELRLYTRALSADEVAARYEAGRANFKPAPLEKAIPGTLDGRPFSETGMWKNWMTYYFDGGRLLLGNNGSLTFVVHSMSDVWNIGLLDQQQRREKFWTEVDGELRYQVEENALTLKVKGKSYHGLAVEEELTAVKSGDISFRFTATAFQPNAPTPTIPFRFNLPSASALRFTGQTPDGPVTGNMPDLDSTVRFQEAVEWVMRDLRLGLQLGPGWIYELRGDRSPQAWLGGWSGFQGRLLQPAFANWKTTPTATCEFRIRLQKESAPSILSVNNPRTITADRRFDFSSLYLPAAEGLRLKPADRDVPVFGRDETISFLVFFPKLTKAKRMTYRVTDTIGGKEVLKDDQELNGDFWSLQPQIVFTPPARGVYLIAVTAQDSDGTPQGTAEQEVAVCGEIPQPVVKPGELPAMKKIHEVDFVKAAEPEVFSYSGKSRLVTVGGEQYRQTLTFNETQLLGLRHDWLGCRLPVKNPYRPHLLEIEHPDIDGMNMAVNVVEPQDEKAPADKLLATNRALAGVWTGAGLPSTDRLTVSRLIYYPTTSWCIVTCQNIHDRFMPDKPGATVRRVRLFEIEGELPKLDLEGTPDRLLGIFTESGQMALGTFGTGILRGSNPHMPPRATFYRECLPAVENLAKYLRFRGDSVYLYGAVRYRAAEFQSGTMAPDPGFVNGDLVSLMAKVFEYNGLKLLLGIEANPLINAIRIPQAAVPLSEIQRGAPSVHQQTNDGEIIGSDYGLDLNPFHPLVQAEYANLAAEIGAKYARFPAVAGIAWMTGNQSITCPTLMVRNWSKKEDAKWPSPYQYTYDDETMRQFAAFLKRDLPGRPDDPGRYRERFTWIMNNALSEWTAFRCKAIADMYAGFAQAMRTKAPGMEMFVLDDTMLTAGTIARDLPPLERLRTVAFDPRQFRDRDGVRFALMMPDHHEWFDRGRMRLNTDHWLEDSERWWQDDALWGTLDPAQSGIFLHRQFEEKQVYMPPERGWVFPPRTTLAWCNYPQPAGRGNLAQFARILARATPRLICWMWCDDSTPMGHEQSMQEFAAAYRRIPAGAYETVSGNAGPVVARKRVADSAGPVAFYTVNTSGDRQKTELTGLPAGAFHDAGANRDVKVPASGKLDVTLEPWELKVYVQQK